MPKPVDHTTTSLGLVVPAQTSSRSDEEDATPETPVLKEEERTDDLSIPSQSPLPQMSPDLRLALVKELLKQMQTTSQPKQTAKPEPEPRATTQAYPTQLAAEVDEAQAPNHPTETPANDRPLAESQPKDDAESEEDHLAPVAEDTDESYHVSEPPTQIEATETNSEGIKQKSEANDVIAALKTNAKVDTEVQTEAKQIADLLKSDESESKSTSVTHKPEMSEENKEPVTPSAFILALRERAKNRPSIRGSRTRSRPTPRSRAKKRKSLPRGPRPARASDSEEDEADVDNDMEEEEEEEGEEAEEDEGQEKQEREEQGEELEEVIIHSKESRAKLHQLVNAKLNGQNDPTDVEDIDTQ